MDVTFDGNSMKLNLSDLATWTTWNWIWFGLICNAVYGYVTHVVSLPAVHRYNKKVIEHNNNSDKPGHTTRKRLRFFSKGMLFWILVSRMTVQLPARCIALVLGITEVIVGFLVSWKLPTGTCLADAYRWYESDPEKLVSLF